MLQTAAHPAMIRGLVGLLAIVPASAFAMAWECEVLRASVRPDAEGAHRIPGRQRGGLRPGRAPLRGSRGKARPAARPRSLAGLAALLAMRRAARGRGPRGARRRPRPSRRARVLRRERRGPRRRRDPLQHRHSRAHAASAPCRLRAASSPRCSRWARS